MSTSRHELQARNTSTLAMGGPGNRMAFSGVFGLLEVTRLQEQLRTMRGPLELDFHCVRTWRHPALKMLADVLREAGPRVAIIGMPDHLRRLVVSLDAGLAEVSAMTVNDAPTAELRC